MRKGLVLAVVLVLTLLMSSQAIAGFQESRGEIIQELANAGENDYPVPKAGWERTDLRDGTPRWMNTVQRKYVYELIGEPISKATLLGELGGTEQSGWELGCRIINLIEAVGVTETKAQEVGEMLFNGAVASPGKEYWIVFEKIQAELTYMDLTGMFLLVLTKE